MLGPVISTLASSNGASSGIQLDYLKSGGTAVQVVVNTTGAGLTYQAEYTLDNPQSVSGASQLSWFSSGSSNQSSHAFFNYAFPIRAIRALITAGTSNTSLVMTTIQ